MRPFLLTCDCAERLYEKVKELPIYDYHCHLSPKEIFEDRQFGNIGEMWLMFDHYKWRLMRSCGISEEYVTGNAPYREKFIKYAEAVSVSPGNPLYHWSHMELSMYFGINDRLCAENAAEIWDRANAYIKKTGMSPRKLIAASGVKLICTTDDICDTLQYHKLLKIEGYEVKVLPTFRTDKLFFTDEPSYASYITSLSESSGIKITGLPSLKAAIEARLGYFTDLGCLYSDVGIEAFPQSFGSDAEAERTFSDILAGKSVSSSDADALRGNLMVFLGKLYKKHGIISQIHYAVRRNVNRALYAEKGPDLGTDCINEAMTLTPLAELFNRIGDNPKTIVYALDPALIAPLVSLAGSFRGVGVGAAWWFCDTKSGIRRVLETVAELSSLSSFNGMLTDSRSFLSYARHDYYRRILCSLIGEWVESGEYGDENAAADLVKRLSTRC